METVLRKDGSVWFVVSSRQVPPSWTGEYDLTIAPHGGASSVDEWVETKGIMVEDGFKET